jgi:type IV secretion system protein VirB11
MTLDEYVASGVMTQKQCDVIRKAVEDHKNILVVGGTSSGKTTLVNAIIAEISNQFPNERLIIIEDTGEIQCMSWNNVTLHTTVDISMIDLLKAVLRMRPDRILVGEVRGAETLSLLMAWNTGHPGGVSTFHANTSKAALNALVQRISMNKDAPSPIEPLIGEAVQVIVNIAKTEDKVRRIQEIIAIDGYENGQYLIRKLD